VDAGTLYDAQNPWDPDRYPLDGFWTELVMAAPSVVDVGCGTGSLLHDARGRGHSGRLAGIDPDPEMLDRARRRTDVEWVLGRAADIPWAAEFALATMTSNAFQCLISDDEVRDSLAAVRRSLVDGGRFGFDTRNPAARAWEEWYDSTSTATVDGREIEVFQTVEAVEGDVVHLLERVSEEDTVLRTDRAPLRFLSLGLLGDFLTAAGFEVEEQYGGADRSPATGDSRSFVTVARAV
jgi:SAM-dependent methyltransferase